MRKYVATIGPIIWQSLAAVAFMTVVLLALSSVNSEGVLWAIGAGALSSSSCIVFMTPRSSSGRAGNLIGGYAIGTIVGVTVHLIISHLMPVIEHDVALHHTQRFWVLGSISVGITMVLMVVIDVLHPPAVGVSLVLVLNIKQYEVVAVILLSVLVLAIIRQLLDSVLQTLVE